MALKRQQRRKPSIADGAVLNGVSAEVHITTRVQIKRLIYAVINKIGTLFSTHNRWGNVIPLTQPPCTKQLNVNVNDAFA